MVCYRMVWYVMLCYVMRFEVTFFLQRVPIISHSLWNMLVIVLPLKCLCSSWWWIRNIRRRNLRKTRFLFCQAIRYICIKFHKTKSFDLTLYAEHTIFVMWGYSIWFSNFTMAASDAVRFPINANKEKNVD